MLKYTVQLSFFFIKVEHAKDKNEKEYQISVKELPSFRSGMCYTIEVQHPFDASELLPQIGITVQKRNEDLEYVKVWMTSDLDYLAAAHSLYGNVLPFKFDVTFEEKQATMIAVVDARHRPLICNDFDDGHVSEQQCIVNHFLSNDLTVCPQKCLPIQMKGFQYINQSSHLEKCANLEAEACNGGPKVWDALYHTLANCLVPCEFTTYIESQLEKNEMTNLKPDPNEAYFELVLSDIRRVEKEVLVYDTNDMIGAIGGVLGLFLGFSFFDVLSMFLDNFVKLANFLGAKMF